jgi:Mg2+ and Co2+ transporter CorA
MIFRHEYPGGVWVDLEQPTGDEIRRVAREFSISERLEAEILSPTPSPLVARDNDAVLLALHFPSHGEEDGDTKNQEIDFIVGNHFVVTVRYEVIVPLHHLKKLLETQELVEGRTPLTTDVLLEILFTHLYASVRDHTNHIANHLETIERDMFAGRERTTVRLISSVSREFLHMESALANQEGPLARFFKLLEQSGFFGASFAERADRMLVERTQIAQLIKTHRAITADLRETNIAILSAHQNEIMKTLTVITFIFLPLELITFVFSMHMPGTPLEQNPDAFQIIIGSMFAIGLVITFFLARKRWIF